MATEFLKDSDNPVIQKQGAAQFEPGHYCTWITANGQNSLCGITNPSSNTLVIIVSGAPNTIYTTDGKLFNGQHHILPNRPTDNVTALGDFQGVTVTITNISNPTAECDMKVTTP